MKQKNHVEFCGERGRAEFVLWRGVFMGAPGCFGAGRRAGSRAQREFQRSGIAWLAAFGARYDRAANREFVRWKKSRWWRNWARKTGKRRCARRLAIRLASRLKRFISSRCPKGAAVNGLTIRVGKRTIKGEIKTTARSAPDLRCRQTQRQSRGSARFESAPARFRSRWPISRRAKPSKSN